jgi:hypothetical protein
MALTGINQINFKQETGNEQAGQRDEDRRDGSYLRWAAR